MSGVLARKTGAQVALLVTFTDTTTAIVKIAPAVAPARGGNE